MDFKRLGLKFGKLNAINAAKHNKNNKHKQNKITHLFLKVVCLHFDNSLYKWIISNIKSVQHVGLKSQMIGRKCFTCVLLYIP